MTARTKKRPKISPPKAIVLTAVFVGVAVAATTITAWIGVSPNLGSLAKSGRELPTKSSLSSLEPKTIKIDNDSVAYSYFGVPSMNLSWDEPYSLYYKITNLGPGTANWGIRVQLGNDFQLTSLAAINGSCKTMTRQCTLDLSVGETATLEIKTKAPHHNVNAGGVWTSVAEIKYCDADFAPTSCTLINVLIVTVRESWPSSDVAITSGSIAPEFRRTVGQPMTYTFSVKNNGPQGDYISFIGKLPLTGITYQSGTGTGGWCTPSPTNTSEIACMAGYFGSGQGGAVSLVVVPQQIGEFASRGTVIGTWTDPNPSNDSLTITTKVVGHSIEPAPTNTKTKSPAPPGNY